MECRIIRKNNNRGIKKLRVMKKNNHHFITEFKSCLGFTLVEVLVSVILLGFMATGISAMYLSGLRSLDAQNDRMLLDSRLRSRMEVLVGTDFAALSNGSDSEEVSINGQNYTIDWTIASIDLDQDGHPESNARQVTVSVAGVSGRSLTTIIVDSEGRLGKI